MVFVSCKTSNFESTVSKEERSKQFLLKDISYREKELIDKGKLKSYHLINLKNYLKVNFGKDIDSLEVLTIFYLQPIRNCHYDSYRQITRSDSEDDKYWENCNSETLSMYYENGYTSSSAMHDFKGIIYNLFFADKPACDGMITINKNGDYYRKTGHGSVVVANAFVNELKLKNIK